MTARGIARNASVDAPPQNCAYAPAMDNRPSIIERAFQLAKSGRYATVGDIRKQLDREHYASTASYVRGGALVSQLRSLIAAARAAPLE